MKTRALFALGLSALFGSGSTSLASLLGVHLAFPLITYQNTASNALTYNATNQLFSIDANPTAVLFSSSEGPALVFPPRSLQVRVIVDNTGALVGGVPGDDLVLIGTVTRGTNIYIGVLLTGEVKSFGFLESGATDQYDLLFTPTGGALLPLFACGDVGLQVTSENSTFNNNFAVSFNGRAKGNVGLVDDTKPSITCPFGDVGGTNAVECQAHANGLPGAYVSYPTPIVSDNCDTNPAIVCAPPSGSFFPLPTNQLVANYTVLCTATDSAGNSNSCSFVIRIQDTLPPEFSDTNNPLIQACEDLSHPITLTNDPGHCYATYTFMKPVAIDNCCPTNVEVQVNAIDEHGITITISDIGGGMLQGQFPVTTTGSNLVTLTASDDRGNTAQHQCPILVIDTEPPTIVCPSNQTVECTGGPIFYEEPVVGDNCPCVTASCIPTNGTTMGVGSHSIICVARDCSGNSNQCSFYVTVQDTMPPSVYCPTNVTVQCNDSTDPSNTGSAKATDACDNSPHLSYVDSSSGNCPRVITRTWTATDYNGNSNACSQTITVQNTNIPSINCPAALVVQCFGDIPAPDSTTVQASALCTTPSKTFLRDAYATNNCVVTISRTYQATDVCGNSNICTQTITVQDTNPPSITAPGPLNVQCFENIPAPDLSAVSASDNCGTPTKSFVGDAYATNGCVITVTRTYKATDACGNTNTAAQIITVQDTIPPSIAAPAPASVQCFGNIPAPDLSAVSASDNCGTPIKSFVGDAYATNGCVITVTRTYKATDACGNTNTSAQLITVQDTNKPSITCPPLATVQCFGAIPSPDPNSVSASDNCGTPTKSFVGDAYATNGCVITVTRTYKATDACGNTNTCAQIITIVTTNLPQLSCPGDRQLACGSSTDPSNTGVATSSGDGCGRAAAISFNDTPLPANCTGKAGIRRTWKATDGCSNSASCDQLITFVDTTPPQINCPLDKQLQCGDSTMPTNTGMATATDNCGGVVTITFSDAPTATNCTGKPGIARTWRATDACSNSVTCVQQISFVDTTPPTITCPTNLTVTNFQKQACCSFPQSGWCAAPDGNNVATILSNYFSAVYTNGCKIGIPTNGYCLKFTSANACRTYLPGNGACGALTKNDTNCASSSAGLFGCQILALQLNVDFADAGALQGQVNRSGDLVLMDNTCPLNGMSLRQILGICNAALGGGNVSAYGMTISNLSVLCDNLNQAFQDCTQSPWAASHICGSGNYVNTGTATATDNCDTNPVVSFSDVVTASGCAGSSNVVRTWKAVDHCGNSNSCIQTITYLGNGASLCGTVFRDCNADGSSSGEAGLPGVTVMLKIPLGLTIRTNVTDANGGYCFNNIATGSYVVVVSPPGNYIQTADPDGTKDSKTTVTLTSCMARTGVAFGYAGCAPSVYFKKTGPTNAVCGQSITYTFAVTNTGNACFYGGLTVSDPLLGGQIFYQTPVSPGQGFLFTSNYVIKATDPTNLVNTATAIGQPPTCGIVSVTSSWTVKVTPCAPCNTGSIAGSVFRDCVASPCGLPHLHDDCDHAHGWCNHDGRDHSHCNHKYGECNNDGKDHSGCRHERGWCNRDGQDHSTCNHAGGRCDRDTRSHALCNHARNICMQDGGSHYECDHARGFCSDDGLDHTACNHRLDDCNRDGRDHSTCRHERGWCSRDGQDHSTCNHASGRCDRDTRDHSQCNHLLNICVQDGHDHSKCSHNRRICKYDGNDHSACDHVSHVCNWDGNNHSSCNHKGGWCNWDGNDHSGCDHSHDRCNFRPPGTCLPGATGLQGVTVQLKNSAGTLLATKTTAADGSYLFSGLTNGTYQVVVLTPAGFTQTVDPDGTLDGLTLITLTACQNKTASFGYLPLPCKYAVSGAVFRDCDANGSLAGDAGISSVIVTLKNSGGTPVATNTTSSSGAYSFTNLTAGTYSIVVTAPANYTQTSDPDGTKDNKTSVLLTNCQNVTSVLFGYTGSAPGVYFKKTGPTNALSGQTITYTFAVTNTGNTCFYGGLHVDDPMLGGRIFYQTPVSPGQGFLFTSNYVVKASDPTNLVNTATATGHPPTGSAVSVQSTWTVRKK